MSQLSPNFTYAEMTFSEVALRTGVANVPDAAAMGCLMRLCIGLLEPARTILGVPLHINSGYRSVEINDAVGSTSAHSAHLDGRAADVVPIGMSVANAFFLLRKNLAGWDQLIFECQAWIHMAIPADGTLPRHEALMASGGPGNWTYSVVV